VKKQHEKWPRCHSAYVQLFRISPVLILASDNDIVTCMCNAASKDELERLRKEVVVSYFKVLYRYLHGGTEENHDNLQ
jgi:hypothetical protein